MINAHTLNGAIRTGTFPFEFIIRMVYQGVRGVVVAIGRLISGIIHLILSGIFAIGRVIRQTLYVIGFVALFPFRLPFNLASKVRHGNNKGILSIPSNDTRTVIRTRRMIVAVAFSPFRLVAWFYAAIWRFAVWSTVSIRAMLRAFAFSFAATSMTLSLEDSHARLLVLKGKQIIAWRSGLIAEPPAVSDPISDEEEESEGSTKTPVFNPLESLLDRLPARTKRVVADLPLHVPLLRHFPLPDVKGSLLTDIVNSEVMSSVPFDQKEVDIQWRVEQGENIKEASVIAVPKDRMDGQVRILRDSVLAPTALYSKATSLAVAVARTDVFILHMTPGQAAVILVREGVTRIVHRIELPTDIEQQAETIVMGVGQVAGYHRSQRPEDDVADLPVVFTGELKQVEKLVGMLGASLNRQVYPFEPDLKCPEGFTPSEFATNIGLHLVSRSKDAVKMFSAQNVLPERHRPRPLPVVPTAVFTGLLILGFLAFNLAGWVSSVSADLAPLASQRFVSGDQARDYRLAMVHQRALDQRIGQADLLALGLINGLESFEQEMDTLLLRIRDLTGIAMFSGVDLTRVVPNPEGFSVSGGADSYPDVLRYAELMRASPNFEDATVLQVTDSKDDQLVFTVQVTVPTTDGQEGE